MKFSKFAEIDNAYRTQTINHMVDMGVTGGEWEVTEKVHGSNGSIWYDGTDMKFAKRSQFVDVNENFGNCNKVMAEMESDIKTLYTEIDNEYHDETEGCPILAIYGEIFGGSYDHPDVEKVKGSVRVQKGVFYTPDNLFYIFDISVNGKYLDTKTVEELCERYDLFYAKPLFRGSFEECMNYPNDEQSHIPGWLGLPTIEDNVCEGVVLRPVEPKFFACGGRVILKNKNEKWTEKAQKRAHIKKETVFTEDAQLILDEFSLYFTENRLKNVLSKIGQVTDKDFGKIMKDLQQDAYDDFRKDHEGDPKYDTSTLDNKEWKLIHKRACSLGTGMIRENFQNIIDGTF